VAYLRLQCPRCEVAFGQESRLLGHLTADHAITDHLALFLQLHHAGVHPTCECSSGCSSQVRWAGWKKGFTSRYARGHNARVDSVWLDEDRRKEFRAKRLEGLASGRTKAWNDGLTKETDTRIADSALKASNTLNEGYASGRLVDWRVGAEDKAHAVASRSSETKRRKFASGATVSWNQGQSKHTSSVITEIGRKISATMCTNPGSSSKRFKLDELAVLIAPALKQGKLTLLTDLTTYRNKYQRLSLQCTECSSLQDKSLMMLLATPKCFACHPKESVGQLELYDFVRSLAPDAVLSDRGSLPNNLEVDVLVPSHKLAIEYDGLWWHGAERQDDFHRSQRKMQACTDAGLRFMVVYEDEWRDKRSLVQDMIRHRLRMHLQTLDARKLKVVQVNSKHARAFLDANHLDGHTPAHVTCGLVDVNGALVAVASLRRPFHRSHGNVFELARACTLVGTTIRGWLGKLTHALCDHARKAGKDALITYVDNRVGTGSGYLASGWELVKANTGPRFWWTDYVSRIDRFAYRADKGRGMSQQEVADEAGVVQIFGCSNSLWRRPL
jgi:hypothetical protein